MKAYQIMLVGCVALLHSSAAASDPSRELRVGFRANQIQLPLDSLAHPADSIDYINPKFDTLFHQIGVISARYACPAAVLRTGIWGQLGPKGVPKPNFDNHYTLTFESSNSRDQAFTVLANQEEVPFIRIPDTVSESRSVEPNDPGFGLQWGLKSPLVPPYDIGVTRAWEYTVGSSDILVGVVDDGTEPEHEDFRVGGISRVVADPNIPAGSSHGTSVVGVIAAVTNNDTGLAGIDWHARIHARMKDEVDDAGDRTIELVDEGADVINHSYGKSSYDDRNWKAMTYAYNNDVVSVAAMDDKHQVSDPYDTPSAHPGVIAVGSIRWNGTRSPASAKGGQIDLVAPGGYSQDSETDRIRVLVRYAEKYAWNTGTSFAAPHVTGVVSLLRGKYPELSNDDIYQVLTRTAFKWPTPGWDSGLGYGLVKADSAFWLLQAPNRIQHGSAQPLAIYSVSDFQPRALSIPQLASDRYTCKVYELRKAVSFSKRYYSRVADWNRGSYSLGFSDKSPNVGVHFSDFVPGTVTAEGAVARTYVYEVWYISNHNDTTYYGFFPCAPQDAKVAWTNFGEELLVSPPLTADVGTASRVFTWWQDTLNNEAGWHIDRQELGVWHNDYRVLPADTVPGTKFWQDTNAVWGSSTYLYRIHPANAHQTPAAANIEQVRTPPNRPACLSAYVLFVNTFSPTWDPSECTGSNTSSCDGCGDGIIIEESVSPPFGEGMEQQSSGGGGGDPEGCQASTAIVVEWDPPDYQPAGTIEGYQLKYHYDGDDYYETFDSSRRCDTICIGMNKAVSLAMVSMDHEYSSEYTSPSLQLYTGNKSWCGGNVPEKRVALGEPNQPAAVKPFGLIGNSPNPFNAGTIFSFTLANSEHWNLSVVDVLGRTVRSISGNSPAGPVDVSFDGRDASGSELASGVYFWRVITPTASAVRKMAIVK